LVLTNLPTDAAATAGPRRQHQDELGVLRGTGEPPTAGGVCTGAGSRHREARAAAVVEVQNVGLPGELVSCGRRTVVEYMEQWHVAVQASLEPAGCTNSATSCGCTSCRGWGTCSSLR
jgi:hypothetical protein